MADAAIQDLYPEATSHCYGCGYSNEKGHKLKSYWNGGAAKARFLPGADYTAMPGYVYGGLLASLIDCHATATAAAACCHAKDVELAPGTLPRFVTAALKIDYLLPTPVGIELELQARALEVRDRKVVVEVELLADSKLCATGNVVTVRMPDSMLANR